MTNCPLVVSASGIVSHGYSVRIGSRIMANPNDTKCLDGKFTHACLQNNTNSRWRGSEVKKHEFQKRKKKKKNNKKDKKLGSPKNERNGKMQ